MHKKTNSVPLALKPRLPDYSKIRYSSRLSQLTPELAFYGQINDKSHGYSGKALKFFKQISNDVSKSTIVKSSEAVLLPLWEIQERIDSFHMRSEAKNLPSSNPEKIFADFELWDKTVSEITKTISFYSCEFSDILFSMHSETRKLFKSLYEMNQSAIQESQQKHKFLKLKILDLNKKVKLLTIKLKENDEIRINLDKTISEELKEIFGDESLDTVLLKKKIHDLKNKERTPAVDLLKDILEQLSRENYIPEYKPQLLPQLDISEYQTNLQDKFKQVQMSTATKILKYFDNKTTVCHIQTQTIDAYIDPTLYIELKELYEKTNKQLIITTGQFEKYRDMYMENEIKVNDLQDEKAKLMTETMVKSNELNHFVEKEKILKNKLKKYRTENFGSDAIGNPYIKERASVHTIQSVQFKSVENDKDHKVLQNILEKELKITNTPSRSQLSTPRPCGSRRSNSRSSARSSNMDQGSEISSVCSEENHENSDESQNFSKNDDTKRASFEGEYDNSVYEDDLKEKDFENLQRKYRKPSNTSEASQKIGMKYRKPSNVSEISQSSMRKNTVVTEKMKKNAPLEGNTSRNSRSRQKKTPVDPRSPLLRQNTIEKSPGISKKPILKNQDLKKAPDETDKVTNQSYSKQVTYKKQSFPDQKPILTHQATVEKSLKPYKESIEENKEKLQSPKRPLIKHLDAVTTPLSNMTSEDNSTPSPKKDTLPEYFPYSNSEYSPHDLSKTSKKLNISGIFKNKPRKKPPTINTKHQDKSILENALESPSSDNDRPTITYNNLEDVYKAQLLKSNNHMIDIGVGTGKGFTIKKTADFSAQFGPLEPNVPKEIGVYITPYNPNNLYGLKGDTFFHSSRGVFGAQPSIPELSSSYVFMPPFHVA